MVERWGRQGEEWLGWLRRSAPGVELFTWWQEADDHLRLVGEDAYWQRVVDLLGRASRRDCAAAGLGCARRNDRACPEPSVCAGEPVAGDDRFEGPVPGGCAIFYGYRDATRVRVVFTDDDRHRAVFWCPAREPVRLWVDGVAVRTDAVLDTLGTWVGDRLFVTQVEGPGDHPRQSYGPGELLTRILSILIYDAELAATRLLLPQPDECWTDPRVRLDGTTLSVYPDRAAGQPDRTLPIGPP
jgi:hypothetical protein